MKKGKLLSALTSLAVTGSMIAGAVPSMTASAASNPLGLAMTSAKTEFTLSEIQAGASAKVYVDAVGTVTDNDYVKSVEFALESDAWGRVDPINFQLSDHNKLSTDSGSWVSMDECFNGTATTVISAWDTSFPDEPGYALFDFKQLMGSDFKYDNTTPPKAIIMSDSGRGFIKTEGEGEHIAEFDVKFPTDLAAGKYTISFVDPKSIICTDGDIIGKTNTEMAPCASAQSITFTVTGDSAETTTTTETPQTTPADTNTTLPKVYDGTATIEGEKDVKGAVGEIVNVPVYLKITEADPPTVEGYGFKVVYDTSALKLKKFAKPQAVGLESGVKNGTADSSPTTGTYLYKLSALEPITVDNVNPCVVLQFEVLPGASGTYPIKFVNHLNEANPVEIIHECPANQDSRYLTPTVINGSIVVGDAETTTEEVTTTTTTEQITTTSTEAPVTTSNSRTTLEKQYVGDAYLKGQTDVVGKPGDVVNVPVYLELGADVNPKTIEGLGFKVDYDVSALELVKFAKPAAVGMTPGLTNGSVDSNVKTGVYLVKMSALDPITVDASNPVCVLQFKIRDNAGAGEYPIEFLNHLNDANPVEIVRECPANLPTTYLTPHVTNGSVIIDSAITTTTTDEPVVTTTTTSSEPTTTDSSVVTSLSIVTSMSVVTSMSEVTSVVTSMSVVTSYTVVTDVSGVTSISVVTSLSEVTSIVTSVSVVTSLSVVTVTEPVGTTSSDPINTDDPTATSVSFNIVPEIEGQNAHWYYADHDEWNVAAIEVFEGGVKVDNPELTFTVDGKEVATPGDAYNGADFNYEVTVTYKGQSTTINAKIGLRGDANLNHKSDVRDAAAIAKDLAQLYKSNKTTLTDEEGFGIFLANADEGLSDKVDAYKPYDFGVRDAATIAKWLSRSYKDPNLTLWDVAVDGK